MNEETSLVAEWYTGRSIFVTGGTGFMGKVLLEKLLFACPEIDSLYVLMRPKRGKSPEERLDTMFALPMFDRLRTINPNVLKKIKPLTGDLSSEGLGLNANDTNLIIDNVSVVFHMGATLRLEAELKDAIELNTAGTQRVIDLSKKIKNLRALIHLSTAFCSADFEVFEEKVYNSPDDPKDVISVAKWMKNEALVKATPSLIAPHPNTYTYSKRLAESLVASEAGNMRVAIVRPSIVTPSCVDPIPGWVDSLNGPMGVMVASSKGVLRSMHCKGENRANIVPVDIAINGIIVIAWKLGSAANRPNEIPVYNMTNDSVVQVTWNDILSLGKKHAYKYPFEMQIWYPNGDIHSSYIIHYINCILFHWIPAIFIDCLLFIFGQKRFMMRVQRKIHDGLELLQFFTTRPWIFRSEQFLALTDDLNHVDKKLFMMDYNIYPMDTYMVYCILGARQYCMKEDLKSLTRCRVQQTILYGMDKLVTLLFYSGLIYMIWSWSESVQVIFKFIGDYVRNLPLLNTLLLED